MGGRRRAEPPNQKLYYQIVLGTIDMETAVSSLLQVYADSRIEKLSARGEAVLATIMVDREGRPVVTDAVAISSFGWGVPVSLTGKLRDLENWSQAEQRLVEQLEKKIVSEDKDGKPLPLTAKRSMPPIGGWWKHSGSMRILQNSPSSLSAPTSISNAKTRLNRSC